MSHERNVHGAAVGFVLTGVRTADAGVPGVRGPNSSVNDHPNLGSAIGRFVPPETPVPAAVACRTRCATAPTASCPASLPDCSGRPMIPG
jgi:hypothetical protein